MQALSFFLKRKDKYQKCKRRKLVFLEVRQMPMKADWWDTTPLAHGDLAEAIPKHPPPHPTFTWTPCLLIFCLSVGPPTPYYLERESNEFKEWENFVTEESKGSTKRSKEEEIQREITFCSISREFPIVLLFLAMALQYLYDPV